MAKPKARRGDGKAKGKGRKGPVKGAKESVGLGEKSRPKFKRNPHKFKKAKRKEKASAEKKSAAAESEAVAEIGSKRKNGGKQEQDLKRVRVSEKERQPLTRKERRNLKRRKRKNYDLISRTLQLWEKLRRHDLAETERSHLLEQMMSAISGHICEFSLKHDTARIVQCCLKYGTPQHHTTIFNELKDHIVELSKSKYAKFTMKAMMRLCTPEQRHQLISGLYGHVRRLAQHKEAAEVVETAYNDYANASERASLVEEFYGPKFALFKSREGEERSLEEILGAGGQERDSVLGHMKEALLKLLDKSVVRHSIVHRALLDYLTHCDETCRSEMIDQLKEVLVEILHTRDGSRVVLHCLWHGTPKVRKAIVKSFKSFVRKICLEENGHVVMMAVFDTVDDTVLVKKTLISEMVAGLEELCNDTFGRRVLLYLLSPRNKKHFSSQFVQSVLEPGDGNQHTKKPHEVRHKELLEGVASGLLELAGMKAGEWAQSKPHSPLLLQLATSLPGSVSQFCDPLVELLALPFNADDHIVVHPSGHWIVKRLLHTEEQREGEEKGGTTFAERILDTVPADDIQAWATTNRGAFVVCSLVSSKVAGVRERVALVLNPVSETIRTGDRHGQKALWKELRTSSKPVH